MFKTFKPEKEIKQRSSFDKKILRNNVHTNHGIIK